MEASPQPERAREAADRLRNLVPDAGHLVHMPSHIDVRLGRWAEAAAANEKAMDADARYNARKLEPGFWGLYMAHNRHFLGYTAMMEGRREVALGHMQGVVTMFPPSFVKENALFVDAFMTAYLDALKRFGEWQAILDDEAVVEGLPVSTAHRHFARAVALAALGRVPEAEKEAAAFRAAVPACPRRRPGDRTRRPARWPWPCPTSRARSPIARGTRTAAIAKLREAVAHGGRAEVRRASGRGRCRRAIPSGAVLIASRRYADAEAVYRADLKRYPENGWSLRGLAQALEAQGKRAEAADGEGAPREGVGARRRRWWTRPACASGPERGGTRTLTGRPLLGLRRSP